MRQQTKTGMRTGEGLTCVLQKGESLTMPTIQIRNVPHRLHRRLKERAARLGLSFSAYVLAELEEIADRPMLAELRERLHKREPVTVRFDSARLVREEREAR